MWTAMHKDVKKKYDDEVSVTDLTLIIAALSGVGFAHSTTLTRNWVV